jgi:hypothetical protein
MAQRIFLYSFLMVSLVQCSLFEDARKRRSPEVRDLPRQARDDGANLRRRVVVLPFIDKSPYATGASVQAARDTVVRQLNLSGEVVVLSASDLEKPPQEYFDEDGYEIEKIIPMARKIGAHAIVVGRIQEIKTRKIGDSVGLFRKIKAEVSALVDVEMYSTKSGNSIVKETRSATVEEEVTRVAKASYTDKELRDNPQLVRSVVKAAFAKMVKNIILALRKMSWTGRIALVRGEKIYLNAGRLSGLQVGDILQVAEAKEEIYDPETGGYLGNITGRMKGTIEVISYFGKDGSVTIVHSGSGFEQNDIVEFY